MTLHPLIFLLCDLCLQDKSRMCETEGCAFWHSVKPSRFAQQSAAFRERPSGTPITMGRGGSLMAESVGLSVDVDEEGSPVAKLGNSAQLASLSIQPRGTGGPSAFDVARVSSGVHNVSPDGAQPWTGASPPDPRQCETGRSGMALESGSQDQTVWPRAEQVGASDVGGTSGCGVEGHAKRLPPLFAEEHDDAGTAGATLAVAGRMAPAVSSLPQAAGINPGHPRVPPAGFAAPQSTPPPNPPNPNQPLPTPGRSMPGGSVPACACDCHDIGDTDLDFCSACSSEHGWPMPKWFIEAAE